MSSPERIRRNRLIAGLSLIPVAVVIVLVTLVVRSVSNDLGPRDVEAAMRRSAQAAEQASTEARARLREGRHEAAEAILRRALESSPNHSDLRSLLAEALLAQGRSEEAYSEYDRAIAAGADQPEMHFAAGTTASVAGLPEQAVGHYELAQRLDPGNPKYPLYLGQVQRNMGRVGEAKASLLRAVRLAPDLAIGWGTLADIALAENNLSLAEQHARRAIGADPDSTVWRVVLARALRRANRPQEAARLLMAIEEPTRLSDPMILRELGLCFGLLGEPGRAAEIYARAVETREGERGEAFADLLYQAAAWYERAGEADVAAVYAERALEQGHDRAHVMVERLATER